MSQPFFEIPCKNILLASHGTSGACAAETVAINLLSGPIRSLHHLIVVPDLWKGMLGDDWLNNAITQIRFGNYVEGELTKEIQENIQRVKTLCEESGIAYHVEVKIGKPAECLLQVENLQQFDLVVMGSPRPKDQPGLNSRMNCETLSRFLPVPLLVVPYP